MDSEGSKKLARLIAGGADVLSMILFTGVWVATMVTSGFSLAGTQTFAGWTYFPMFWPHLAASTLGLLMFLRYGANFVTAVTTVLLWMVAWVADLYGAIVYWYMFWLCNVGPKNQLSGLGRDICDSEDALLISMMVLGTLLWVISWAGAIAHGFDLFPAGKSGSSKPGREISAAILWIGLSNVLTVLVFFGLWLANWITTSISVGGGQTYGVWTYANIFLIQLPASVLGIMMFLRYGSNWFTAAASIVLWAISFFAALYGAGLYWRLGWFCKVASVSTLSGNQLVICTQEESYLIALWVLTTALWVFSIIATIAHAYDFFAAGRSSSVRVKISSRKSAADDDDEDVVPENDLEEPPETTTNSMNQYGSYNDGSLLSGNPVSPAAIRGVRSINTQLFGNTRGRDSKATSSPVNSPNGIAARRPPTASRAMVLQHRGANDRNSGLPRPPRMHLV